MKFSLFLILLLSSFNLHASELDSSHNLRTLFTTPQLRTQLDQLRNQGKYKSRSTSTSSSALIKPVKIKMQGIVIRKNKKPVIFVNDRNNLKSNKINNDIIVSTKNTGNTAYKIPVRVNQKMVKLKPGQQWDESSKKIEDNYQIKPIKKQTVVTEKILPQADN